MSASFDVIVLGAGAAGMMCAGEAGRRGLRVLLIDHRPQLGERIRISGGGRCNFTNRDVRAEHYLSQNPRFCRNALRQFSARDFIARVQAQRIPFHEREHGQLFCDRSAQDILQLLRSGCPRESVQWLHPCQIQAVQAVPIPEGAAESVGARYRVSTDQGVFEAPQLVMATGGLAIPQIGASPLGYELAKQFGVPVIAPKPALVPLALPPETLNLLKPLSGTAIKAGALCAVAADGREGQTRFEENVLLTHRGLSGPAILQISSYWQQQTQQLAPGQKLRPITLDLLPQIDDATEWQEHHRRSSLAKLLAPHLPARLIQAWLQLQAPRLSQGDTRLDRPLAEWGKRDWQVLWQGLKQWAIMPSGTLGYAKAEVTLGGVDTQALHPDTLEVRHQPGLYFIGEVVDVTGWLGGYNFQWAWSSGWSAGQHLKR